MQLENQVLTLPPDDHDYTLPLTSSCPLPNTLQPSTVASSSAKDPVEHYSDGQFSSVHLKQTRVEAEIHLIPQHFTSLKCIRDGSSTSIDEVNPDFLSLTFEDNSDDITFQYASQSFSNQSSDESDDVNKSNCSDDLHFVDGQPTQENPDPLQADGLSLLKCTLPFQRSKSAPGKSDATGARPSLHLTGGHPEEQNSDSLHAGCTALRKRKVPFQTSKSSKSTTADSQPNMVVYPDIKVEVPEDWQAVQDSEICSGYRAADSPLMDYPYTCHNAKMEEIATLPPTSMHTTIHIKRESLDTSYEASQALPETETYNDVPSIAPAHIKNEPSDSPVETITMPEWGIMQTCELEKSTATDSCSDSNTNLADQQALSPEDYSSSDPPKALRMFINSAYLESCLKSENPDVKRMSTDFCNEQYPENELSLSIPPKTSRNKSEKNRPLENRTEMQCSSSSSKVAKKRGVGASKLSLVSEKLTEMTFCRGQVHYSQEVYVHKNYQVNEKKKEEKQKIVPVQKTIVRSRKILSHSHGKKSLQMS